MYPLGKVLIHEFDRIEDIENCHAYWCLINFQNANQAIMVKHIRPASSQVIHDCVLVQSRHEICPRK